MALTSRAEGGVRKGGVYDRRPRYPWGQKQGEVTTLQKLNGECIFKRNTTKTTKSVQQRLSGYQISSGQMKDFIFLEPKMTWITSTSARVTSVLTAVFVKCHPENLILSWYSPTKKIMTERNTGEEKQQQMCLLNSIIILLKILNSPFFIYKFQILDKMTKITCNFSIFETCPWILLYPQKIWDIMGF